jgi:hypothetical protein
MVPTAKTRRLSRQHKPADMALDDWQIELRRQFGREQLLRFKNIGADPVFPDSQVSNPQRGSIPGHRRRRDHDAPLRGSAAADDGASEHADEL